MPAAPKHPDQRARRNKDAVPWAVIEGGGEPQPKLPADRDWCQETVDWWKLWGASPQARYFGTTDWAAMLDTARVHDGYWRSSGRAMLEHAAELRLRLAQFGAAPSDRLRLRIQFATAEETEAKAAKAAGGVPPARGRREPLKALDVPDPAEEIG